MTKKTRFWLWLGIGVGVWMLVRTTSNIIRLYRAGGRVEEAEKELILLEVKKKDLELKLEESSSSAYLERIAREKLGLGKPGEIVVVMEDNQKEPNLSFDSAQDGLKPNWKMWRKLYLGF